jgi:hypothetical protein
LEAASVPVPCGKEEGNVDDEFDGAVDGSGKEGISECDEDGADEVDDGGLDFVPPERPPGGPKADGQGSCRDW